MYYLSELTGKIYLEKNGNFHEINIDDNDPDFNRYLLEKEKNNFTQVPFLQFELDQTEKPKVPVKVKKADFKLALIKAGISTSDVTNFIYNMEPSFRKDKIIVLWEDTEEFYRDDSVLNEMVPLFNINQEQLDQIFLLTLKN